MLSGAHASKLSAMMLAVAAVYPAVAGETQAARHAPSPPKPLLATTIKYLDLQVSSVAEPVLRQHFHIANIAYSCEAGRGSCPLPRAWINALSQNEWK